MEQEQNRRRGPEITVRLIRPLTDRLQAAAALAGTNVETFAGEVLEVFAAGLTADGKRKAGWDLETVPSAYKAALGLALQPGSLDMDLDTEQTTHSLGDGCPGGHYDE